MKEVKEVVHVPTRELAEEVLRVAKENGFKEPTFKLEHYLKISGEELCFKFNEVWFGFARKCFYKKEGYTIITAQEFLSRYITKFRPIAMKCTQEQFNSVKDKLVGCDFGLIVFLHEFPYLINNCANKVNYINNVSSFNKSNNNRQVFEEWNEKTFLEYCGISIGAEDNHKDVHVKGCFNTDKYELEQLRKKNENLKVINENLNKESIEYHNELTLLKEKLKAIEDTPKVGDVCLFWDEGANYKILSKLNENGGVEGVGKYDNCIKATNENIQAKIKELTNK